MNILLLLLGGVALIAAARKKGLGVGAVDGYVLTMKIPHGEYHGVPTYYKYVFCGWDRKGYAIWEDPYSYRSFDEKLYKTMAAAERAVQRIVSDGDGKLENIEILTWSKYTGRIGSIGNLSDEPLSLENILKGVERGWYTARAAELDGFGYVVYLTGIKATGEKEESVYPISKETYDALLSRGIGKAPKRRIYQELEAAQRANIDFSGEYQSAYSSDLDSLAKRFGYKGSKNSQRPLAVQYFNNLKRTYRAIAGTTLPYAQSVIYNERGDEILRYRDYGSEEQQLKDAIDYLTAGVNESAVYYKALADIATGAKLLWTVTDKEREAGKKGLQEELFGRKAPAERKAYISILAAKNKGGITPDMFAHRIWESMPNGIMDDLQIRDIVLDALRDARSPKDAKRILLDAYYSGHEIEEYPDDFYMPEQGRLFDEEELQQDGEIEFL